MRSVLYIALRPCGSFPVLRLGSLQQKRYQLIHEEHWGREQDLGEPPIGMASEIPGIQ